MLLWKARMKMIHNLGKLESRTLLQLKTTKYVIKRVALRWGICCYGKRGSKSYTIWASVKAKHFFSWDFFKFCKNPVTTTTRRHPLLKGTALKEETLASAQRGIQLANGPSLPHLATSLSLPSAPTYPLTDKVASIVQVQFTWLIRDLSISHL